MWDHLPVSELQPRETDEPWRYVPDHVTAAQVAEMDDLLGPECESCMGRYAHIIHLQRKAYARSRLAWLAEHDPTHYYADEWAEYQDVLIDAALDPASAMRERPVDVFDSTTYSDALPLPPVPPGCYTIRTEWSEERGEWVVWRQRVA